MFARTWAFPLSLLFTMTNAFSAAAARTDILSPVPHELRRDIVYSRVDGMDLLMDASIPAGPKAPGVIIVHGGGWVRGNRELDVQPLFKPLSDAGFAWFSIDYRLARDVTQFGVAIDDVENAVRFVKSHADEFNVDPDRIALIGE